MSAILSAGGIDRTDDEVLEEDKVSRIVNRFMKNPYRRKFKLNLHWLSRSSYQKILGEGTNISAR